VKRQGFRFKVSGEMQVPGARCQVPGTGLTELKPDT
jgi:hypothetical protein